MIFCSLLLCRYEWTGGLFGATYVGITILLTPEIGLALVFVSSVSGQIGMSMALDHFGCMGIPRQRVSWKRISAFFITILGCVLSVMESFNNGDSNMADIGFAGLAVLIG